MRFVPVFAALVVLAGCQSLSSGGSSGEDSGHLRHSFTNVTRAPSTEPGFTSIFTYDETFEELRGVGVRLDRSTFCPSGLQCTQQAYSLDIPPDGTFTIPASFAATSDDAGYTETYYGTDYQGNPVALTVTFRPPAG